MWERLTCLCRSTCERGKKAGELLVGSSSVHPVWGGRCVTLWGRLPAWQLRTISLWLRLSLAFSFSFCFSLSARHLGPLIYQFATASNSPISKRAQKQPNCSLTCRKYEYKNIGEVIRSLDLVKCVKRRSCSHLWMAIKWPECLTATLLESTASQLQLN